MKNYSSPQQKVDGRLTNVGDRNFNFNTSILPVTAEAMIKSARQRVPFQRHKQDKIDFDSPPLNNEGNFIAVLRLLAKNIPELKEHLTSGPRNARYISKTVQNELIEIAADQIREFYRECLKSSPHFAIIGDEVTSHGKEILSVCFRFLQVDHANFRVKPEKHEALLDFHFLEHITGQAIAKGILDVLDTHSIDVKNCKAQAYDTTTSMSSSRTGVQSHIKRVAPDEDYQGCCLNSLNLVMCSSSQIALMKNMIDHCHQAYLFFRNSPKRQGFFEHVIKCLCPGSKGSKVNSLCKTRWVKRHSKYSSIFELYPYLVRTWNEMNESLYDEINDWNWDSESRSLANVC